MNPIHLNSSKSQLLFILQKKFYALDYLEQDQLSYYKCFHWTGEWLKSQNRNGLIHRDGLAFLVCFQNLTAQEAYALPQVSLSFRFPSDRTLAGGHGYVIVRAAPTKKES